MMILRRKIVPAALVVIACLVVAALIGAMLARQLTSEGRAVQHSGNIYLSPKSAEAKKGDDVRFDIRITPDMAIDTVTATLAYDTSQLEYQRAEYTDSPFSSQIAAMAVDDTVTVQAAKLGGETITDDSFVGTLVFQAKHDGTAEPHLSAGNAAHAGAATNPTLAGKIVTNQKAYGNSAAARTDQADAADGSTEGEADASTRDSLAERAAAAATRPAEQLLRAVGVSPSDAAAAAPWVTGGFIVAFIVLVGVIGVILSRRFMRRKGKKAHHEVS